MPTGADESLESIREERRAAQEASAVAAGEINVVTSEIADLTTALEVLEVNVSTQEAALASAERALLNAEEALLAAEDNVSALQAEIGESRDQLSARAISSFVGQGSVTSSLLLTDDPLDLVRARSLESFTIGSDTDAIEAYRSLSEDLEIERAIATAAEIEAEELREATAAQLVELEAARDEQARITAEAELRLDRLLSEVAALEQLDSELAARESEAIAALASELSRRPSSGGSTADIPIPPQSEIVWVRGFSVHQSIATNVELMIDHAAADGIALAGWGWRDSTSQIQLRRQHCGTSDYAVYQMPSHECNPPTARPGASMHERGLALDITYNGRVIPSHYSDAFVWLNEHAASYGFYNLPSEPWHWSTTGA